jgi:sugar O-acyltransferase (sialic acid O-acetyltransferase NeuD family)
LSQIFFLKKLLLIGASGHAKVVLDVFERMGKHEIIGFLDANKPTTEPFMGYPVLGTESLLASPEFQQPSLEFFVSIGDNWTRHLVVTNIRSLIPHAVFATGIHPSAQIGKDVQIGAGTIVMAGVTINPSSNIGNFAILNTQSSMDHDGVLGDFASLAPGVVTGGNVQIGAFSAIGLGAKIIHGIQIGEQTVVGAGSLVNKSIPAYNVHYGVPSRYVRERKAGDRYL